MNLNFTSTVGVFQETKVYGRHLIIPNEVAQDILSLAPDKRVIYTINEGEELHAGIMSAGDYRYILLNQEICKKHNLEIGDKCDISLRRDESKYGMPMPREFEEYLQQESRAFQYFEELTPGKQRNLIYIVSKMKSVDKRIEKAHVIVHHLIKNKGALDHKALNEEFKNFKF